MISRDITDLYGTITYWVSDTMDPAKETLFFLHGMMTDHTMFGGQIAFFEKDFNLIVWDAPAHGASRPYAAFTYENAAKAMHQILTEQNISHVILIGQSMGGFISQSFICRYPEMVKGFIAIDSTPFGDYYSKSDIWRLRLMEWMAKLLPEKLLKFWMVKQNACTEKGQANMAAMIAGYSKRELCHLMGIGYTGFLDDNRELQISCPTLLLVGERDKTGKVKQYNKEWAKRTGYELIWVPDAAHNSNADNPEPVNAAILSFVQKLEVGK